MKKRPDLVILPDYRRHSSEQLYQLAEHLSADFCVHILDYTIGDAYKTAPDLSVLVQYIADSLEVRVPSSFHILGMHAGARVMRKYASLYPARILSQSAVGKDLSIAPELRAYHGTLRTIFDSPDTAIDYPFFYQPESAFA